MSDDWDDLWAEASEEAPAPGQEGLFGADEQFHSAWQHWNGMPEFLQDDLTPWRTLVVKFRTPEARQAFAALVDQPLHDNMLRGIWYPKAEIGHYWDKRYRDASEKRALEGLDTSQSE